MPTDDIDIIDKPDDETLARIIAGPEHENLTEAVAADAVDVVPILGDALALKRKQEAEEKGKDMPDKPAFIENAVSDLPPPLDTAGDVLISQNTIRYINENSEASPFIQLDEDIESAVDALPPHLD